MNRATVLLACLLAAPVFAVGQALSVDYDTARTHELKPHRRTIPHEGVRAGFNQLHLTLTVSPTGDITDAKADGDKNTLPLWPDLESEVYQWKFTPFEKNGKPVTAQVEEYIDLVPPERLPNRHVAPPKLKPDSKIEIKLSRSGCYGTCPSYQVAVTQGSIVFDGRGYVAASGKHTAAVDPDAVRDLAARFIKADFYSMDNEYVAGVTDSPTYQLSISVDGQTKQVMDYVGSWVGMPTVVSDLEEAVDTVAGTARWITGKDGLVETLKDEHYNFRTFDAQVLLKQAAARGEAETVQALLDAGVPLTPLPAPKLKDPTRVSPFNQVGMLAAAAEHPDVLRIFIADEVSRDDQTGKNLALINAADAGSLEAVRMLLAYGANPNDDLSKLIVTSSDGHEAHFPDRRSILIYAASSGNPDLVREVLSYHPDIEGRDREGKTALFAAGDYRDSDADGARVECVRLLLDAGANVNARDDDGNTPLHETFLTDVEEELLKRGANINAQNNDGDTPIVTTVDNEAIPLFLKYGADLNLRNKKGQTMREAAEEKGPLRVEALQNALAATQPR
ncbi:MAG TPA: ankyrin repeat domain-containing protein [Terracidiphilus sp.]|nr:ankyrin repeat domain-containing protein [Terracidiphilus sp.]